MKKNNKKTEKDTGEDSVSDELSDAEPPEVGEDNADLDLEEIDLDIPKLRSNAKKKDFAGYSDSSISWYLDQINKIPLLSREEEDRLARGARDGDENSKNRLIKANLRFVVSIAKK